ncbi:hypothetical protein EVAR_40107_1 [Eumeta japonica]|uniref:Uncharacterized protein n=1 Tax=Eumeta variegata TaxID=151549 RepID=A0A4C1W921_EUMVA|nr:hypothetical protein EVAR_40107_1 [Eumeta japonica]
MFRRDLITISVGNDEQDWNQDRNLDTAARRNGVITRDAPVQRGRVTLGDYGFPVSPIITESGFALHFSLKFSVTMVQQSDSSLYIKSCIRLPGYQAPAE